MDSSRQQDMSKDHTCLYFFPSLPRKNSDSQLTLNSTQAPSLWNKSKPARAKKALVHFITLTEISQRIKFYWNQLDTNAGTFQHPKNIWVFVFKKAFFHRPSKGRKRSLHTSGQSKLQQSSQLNIHKISIWAVPSCLARLSSTHSSFDCEKSHKFRAFFLLSHWRKYILTCTHTQDLMKLSMKLQYTRTGDSANISLISDRTAGPHRFANMSGCQDSYIKYGDKMHTKKTLWEELRNELYKSSRKSKTGKWKPELRTLRKESFPSIHSLWDSNFKSS